MVNQLLRRFSVKHRIAAVLLLLTFTLLVSIPLIIVNQKFLIGRLNEVTAIETQAERHLLMASVRIVESRVNLDRYIDGFTPTTKDAQDDVLMAINYVKEARSLTRDPSQNVAMGHLLAELAEYQTLISNIDEATRIPTSLSSVPVRTFELSQRLASHVEQLSETSRLRVIAVNEEIAIEGQDRLTNLFVSYGPLLFACIIFILCIGDSITKPIAELHHWALNFHVGQMSPSIPTTGRDELTHLAQTLNDLTARLSSNHFDLEQKFVESTNQISSAREKLKEEAVLRQQIQQELAERENRYSAIFKYASDGILIAQNGQIRYVNPRFAEIFGYMDTDLVGTSFEEYVVTDDRYLLQDRELRDYSSAARPHRFEVSAVHQSGNLIALELNSGTIDYEGASAVLWIVRDITKRKQAEQRLKITQCSVEYAGDAIYWILPTGQIDYANQVACEWLGYSLDEIQSMTLYDVLPSLSRETWCAHWQQAKDAGMLIFESLHRNRMGETFPAEVRTNYREIDGQEYIFGYVQNITQRKETEANLETAKEAAIAASEAKSQFLSNVTHELRTPMNGVLGMTSLLYDTPLNSEQLEIVDTIRTSGDTLLNIINEVLDFSKLDAGKTELEMTRFDLLQSIEETIDLVALSAEKKGINLLYLFEDNAPRWIVQDVTRVRQILANLLSNAIKFTEEGEVVIRVGTKPVTEADMNADASCLAFFSQAFPQFGRREQLFPLSLDAQPIKITVAVKDTGIGIPADRMGRLFRSFSQVDASTTRRFGGTGLGLVISKRLAEAMGGTMWVESQVGAGSTFYFSIYGIGELGSREIDPLDTASLNDKKFAICVKSTNMQQAVVQYLNSWQTHSFVATDLNHDLFKKQMSDALILDKDTFEDATANQQLKHHLQEMPVVVLANMMKPKAAYEAFPNVTQISTPLRASQLQNALVTAIKKERSFELKKQLLITEHPQVAASLHPQTPNKCVDKAETIAEHRHPLKILLAEDNLVNQKVALGILRKLGYHADVAANGQEVLDAMARQHYELILMDISMPIMDGITATTIIRKEFVAEQQPCIIAVTANAMPGDREKYIDAGMNSYISKPIQISTLQNALEQVLRGDFALQQTSLPLSFDAVE